MKASLFVFALSVISFTPNQAHAGFFSDLFSFGQEIQAAEENLVTKNSQTLALIESSSSVNPDMKNIKDDPIIGIIEDDEGLLSVNSVIGVDTDLHKYSSSEKINIYTVKKGATLESIAKANNVSRAAVLYSNSDLTLSEITEEGRVLTIIPFKGALYTVKKGDTLSGISIKYKVSVEDILEYNNLTSAGSIVSGKMIILPGIDDATLTKIAPSKKTVQSNTQYSEGKPDMDGQGSGGYIWPFPAGVGRVSQGFHDGQAYDFAAPKGTPIYAIQSGKVLATRTTGYNGGYGLYVVLDFDNDAQAIFAHMTKVVAVPGTHVNKGDLIGYVGSTGRSTGPHVHIEFRGGSKNPYKSLRKNAVSSSWKVD